MIYLLRVHAIQAGQVIVPRVALYVNQLHWSVCPSMNPEAKSVMDVIITAMVKSTRITLAVVQTAPKA